MMLFIKKYALAIALGIVGIVFIIGLGIALFKPSGNADDANSKKSLDVVTLTSPFAQTSDSLTVNYGGDADPNTDAVNGNFKVFASSRIPIDSAVRRDLESILPELVAREVIPTYALTYIQVDPGSIQCDPLNNCTMLIYIDSPETLFELKTDYSNGVPLYTLTQKPWKGLPNER